jgi:hypothetical protein
METSLPQAESVMLKLEAKYKEKLELNPDLNRKLVSFRCRSLWGSALGI